MKSSITGFALCACLSFCINSNAQFNAWSKTNEQSIDGTDRKITPERYEVFNLNVDALKQLLFNAPDDPKKAIRMYLPTPEGIFESYRVWSAPCMEPGLQAEYPQIRTFSAINEARPSITAKLDFTETGFHAMILGDATYFIDPIQYSGGHQFQVYYKKDYKRITEKNPCILTSDMTDLFPSVQPDGTGARPSLLRTHGSVKKTYRLALSCTGEYATAVTSSGSPTKAAVLSAMVTTINRVNGIYEKELGIHLNIVDNNDAIIYTNAGTDPFTANFNGPLLLGQNQDNTTSIIGNDNYDIGHIFSTGGGGIASLASICVSSDKAQGVTGSSTPFGDAYDVDYVAHEMGHQFGANHTFNNCSGNENNGTAYEPGSGSTIMGYAGICGVVNNLQDHSDDYFHGASLLEIFSYISGDSWGGTGASCGSTGAGAVNISVPSINATYTIPTTTAFELTAPEVSWPEGPLSYSWEQWDLGDIGLNEPNGATATNAPNFRSYRPTGTGTRSFPHTDSVHKNKYNYKGERTSTVSRTTNAKLTVRGVAADGYGNINVTDQVVTIHIHNTGAPFRVTTPNTGAATWQTNTTQTVSWAVAGTNTAPVNASNVNIYLSTDGGSSYPYLIGAEVPNTGSAEVLVPIGVMTSQARVKVKGAGNIFYDVSDADFSITLGPGSANNMKPEDMFSLYPNPVNDDIVYIHPTEHNLSFTLNIYNIIGQRLYQNTYSGASKVDVSLLHPGIYTFEVIDNKKDKRAITKVVRK